MRLSQTHIQAIRDSVSAIAGPAARVRVFGSRLRDDARGGDLDLLVQLPEAVEHPAQLAAGLSARISRTMHGRQVDIVLLAPNLRRLPIHDIALDEGVLL
jgi:predicted nucleotidyltransferase